MRTKEVISDKTLKGWSYEINETEEGYDLIYGYSNTSIPDIYRDYVNQSRYDTLPTHHQEELKEYVNNNIIPIGSCYNTSIDLSLMYGYGIGLGYIGTKMFLKKTDYEYLMCITKSMEEESNTMVMWNDEDDLIDDFSECWKNRNGGYRYIGTRIKDGNVITNFIDTKELVSFTRHQWSIIGNKHFDLLYSKTFFKDYMKSQWEHKWNIKRHYICVEKGNRINQLGKGRKERLNKLNQIQITRNLMNGIKEMRSNK